MNYINFSKKNTGFTIVETLVAVAILMISIAGPLTIAQKGLTAAIYARDQVTASFLAQDAMEIIKNDRDAALDADGFEAWIADVSSCTENNPCGVNTYPNVEIRNSICCQLYISDTEGYTTSASNPKSQFSREFYIKRLPTDDPNYANEATAFVTVDWRNGTVANVVTLEYEIFNVQR